MLDLENGIESFTNLKRNTADYLQQLHQTGTPLVLTVIREGLADSALAICFSLCDFATAAISAIQATSDTRSVAREFEN